MHLRKVRRKNEKIIIKISRQVQVSYLDGCNANVVLTTLLLLLLMKSNKIEQNCHRISLLYSCFVILYENINYPDF